MIKALKHSSLFLHHPEKKKKQPRNVMNLLFLLESDQTHWGAKVKACLEALVITLSTAEQDNFSVDVFTVFLRITNPFLLHSSDLFFPKRKKTVIIYEYIRSNVLTVKS